MANSEIQTCILCFKVISGSKFRAIENTIKDILDVLLLKQDLKDESNPVMCNVCFGKLLAAFEFKSTCIYTDNMIMNYMEESETKQLDIKDIFTEKMGQISENQKVCRLCMKLVTAEFMFVHAIDDDLLQTCIPEINLEIIIEPLVCKYCYNFLRYHGFFLRSCLTTQEEIKIKNEMCVDEIDEEPVEKPIDVDVKSEFVGIKIEKDEPIIEKVYIKKEEVYIKSEAHEHRSLTSLMHSKIEAIINSTYYQTNCKSNLAIDRLENINELGEKIHKCKTCKYQTKYRSALVTHQLMHKDVSEITMHECGECDYRTKYKSTLLRHRLKHRDAVELEDKMLKCNECNYRTKYKSTLSRHLLIHKDVFETDMYKCDQCNFQTKHKQSFKHHEAGHTGGGKPISNLTKILKCNQCDYSTRRKNNLTRHQTMHSLKPNLEMYKCKDCDFESKFKHSFRIHRLQHKNPADVSVCVDFDYQTYRTSDLDVEDSQLMHCHLSEVKLFKCKECEYQTVRKSNLTRHQLVHAVVTNVKMYKCEDCGYESKHKENVTRHQSLHSRGSGTDGQSEIV